jgi:hypothetical protein
VHLLTIQIDDAGVGDLLYGVVIGAHRKETSEFHYDLIPVRYFQEPDFKRKLYLKKATEVTLDLLKQMKLLDKEQVEICTSFLFDETRPALSEQLGEERVRAKAITGEAQDRVEGAYLDEIRNLGYEPISERDDKRAKSFFHMLRWIKKDRSRLKYAKTGWPRLRRYMSLVTPSE